MNPKEFHAIVTADDAYNYIKALHEAGLLFHFDDDAEDCLRNEGLTIKELRAVQANVDQLGGVDYSDSQWEDAFDIALSIFNA